MISGEHVGCFLIVVKFIEEALGLAYEVIDNLDVVHVFLVTIAVLSIIIHWPLN